MKTTCGVNHNAILVAVLLLVGTASFSAFAAANPPLLQESFKTRDAWNRDPVGGKLELVDGGAIFRDMRQEDQLSQAAPPTWTRHCQGNAPPGSILQVRIKAPVGMEYWLDLVNEQNKSIATVQWSEGTGQWQDRRAAFSGQFGSKGDDLFVRVRKKPGAGVEGVQIASIAIVQAPQSSVEVMPEDQWQALLQSKDNLALAKHECFVLSRSFQDVGEHYTDHLIDGNPQTVWRSWPGAPFPQWVEMNWEYPLRVDRLRLVPGVEEQPQKIRVQIPRDDEWIDVQTFDAPPIWPRQGIDIVFPTVATDRLRVVIDAADGSAVSLAEIAAFGPPQPLVYQLLPYWHAHYIWYPEPDQQVKAEPRYFRKTFTISDLKAVSSAFVQARSNDGYILYINGEMAAAGSVDIKAVDVQKMLRQGENVLAAEVMVRRDPGWPLLELLVELAINTDQETTWIGTDASWRCSNTASGGWKDARFQDRDWKLAFISATPPDEPWGRIPYVDVSEGPTLEVDSVKSSPSPSHRGHSLNVEVMLRTKKPLNQDYLLILQAGEIEINPDRSNYMIAKAQSVAQTSKWTPNQPQTVRFLLELPAYAPAMTVPLRLDGLGLMSRQGLRFALNGNSADHGKIATLKIESDAAAPATVSIPAPVGAALRAENGVCKITAGGQAYAPFLWALQSPSLDRFGKYSAAGIHLYHLQIYPYRIDQGVDYETKHFAFVDQHIRHLLAIDPQARILVEMDLRESAAWDAAHPDELLVTAQGVKKSASFASAAYAQDVRDYVQRLVRFMNQRPYAARIMGYIPEIAEPESSMGGADQNGFQSDRAKLNIGDYNPQAIAMFRDYLREKYGDTLSELQKAWKNPLVTFDSAAPNLADLTEEGVYGGVFRDPTEGRMPFDYFEFLSTMVPRFILKNVAQVIKEETGGRGLVGFYYGYVVETLRSVNNPGALLQGNHFYFSRMIDSPLIDFYMSPLQYDHRMAGDRMFPFQPVDTLRLHRKLYIAEEDLRTYVASLTSYGRQRSEAESLAVLENHLGTAIIKGTGAWMADWSLGAGHARSAVPYFATPPLLKTIERMKHIYDRTLDLPRTSATRIAVFVSPQTMYYHDIAYASVIYYNLVTRMLYTQLPNIGAPFDIYTMDDLDQAFVQKQYKLYILLNPFFMDEQQRVAVQKLKRDGNTLLFFYAPGYISNERGLQIEDIRKISGFNVDLTYDRQILSCATDASNHPLLHGIIPGTKFTAEGFDYAPETAKIHPAAFSPRINIADPQATVLAHYADHATALAARDFGDWKAVYAAVPYLDTAMLHNIAQWAGVHLYTEPGVIVEANNQFLLLHNGFDRDRELDIRLPRSGDVYDLLADQPIAAQTDHFHIKLPRCRTMFYQVK